MNIYLRKIYQHDIDKQISVTQEIVKNFFVATPENNPYMKMIGKNSNYQTNVKILFSTDPRLSGEIKELIRQEGDMKKDDILCIKKDLGSYLVEVFRPSDSKYQLFSEFLLHDRHLVIQSDDNIQEISINNEQAFRDWMGQQKKGNGELYADATIDQECNRIKDVKSKDSIKDIMPCENLFKIDDAESIDKVRKDLENKIAEDESAKNETAGLPDALNLYYSFLVWKHSPKTEDNGLVNDILNKNLWGIHINGKQDALAEDNGHICIGWSDMGDLSGLNEVEDFKKKYKESYPDKSNQSAGKASSQIKKFVCDLKIGDYIIFSESTVRHIGRITSDYIYNTSVRDGQDTDFVNERKVEWLKKNIAKDELSDVFNKALGNRLTVFGLNDFKSAVADLIEGDYVLDYEEREDNTFDFNVKINKDFGYEHNRIVFGAPGTGKSHLLEEQKNELLGAYKGNYERVTFHPDYSYSQFVGTYKPVSYGDEDNKKIKYEFVPGPFTRVLCSALKNIMECVGDSGTIDNDNIKPHLLIIEELNRAKTAAVFGDVFQLLDRKNGVSEYEIETSQDLRKYLANELGVSEDSVSTIKIPNNMFIWATMNSADQGVFPLDTAFKRRWSFEYIDVDNNEGDCDFEIKFNNKTESVKWNKLRKAINNVLSNEPIKAHEDKLLGPYFIKDQKDEDKNTDMFCDKVLTYLFDDVGRTRRKDIFEERFEYDVAKHKEINLNRLSTIREGFKAVGSKIFVKAILSEL